jgi:HK97 gp10 family phage protein
MALPNYVKIKKDGVEYISGLDRCQYTIKELSRAALRDVGKLISKKARAKIPKHSGRARKNMQYWVRSKQEYPDMQVGYKPKGFYGGYFETGTEKIDKIAPFYSSVEENIDEIRRIEGQYLSAIEDENRALGLIDEGETESDDTETG